MYAFEQDVPIDAAVHARIIEELGSELPAGLIAHIAIEQPGGTLRYVDLWQSQEQCDRFTDERLHPIVGRALARAGIRPDGEPPRRELAVASVWGPAFPAASG